MLWLRLLLNAVWSNSAFRSLSLPYALSTPFTASSSDGAGWPARGAGGGVCAASGPTGASTSTASARVSSVRSMGPLYMEVLPLDRRTRPRMASAGEGHPPFERHRQQRQILAAWNRPGPQRGEVGRGDLHVEQCDPDVLGVLHEGDQGRLGGVPLPMEHR